MGLQGRALLSGLLCTLCLSAFAAGDDPARAQERRFGGDAFVGGGAVTVSQPVEGDLFVVGGGIDIDARVEGDALATGGKIRLGAEVGQSLFAAGGQVNLAGKVGRNARLAGGQVELGPKSEVAGNLSVAGGQVRLHGAVRGHVQAAGGRVLIDGPVGGDVLATSGQVELGPNARIAGKLGYRSGEPLRRDPAAQVQGGVEKLMPVFERVDREDRHVGGVFSAWHAPRGVGVLWTLGLVLLAATLLAALPQWTRGLARTLRERPGASLLTGFVLLVCVPVGAVLLMVTVIGIPLALAAIGLYLALLPVAYVGAAIGLGEWALQRWRAGQAGALPWRIGAAAVALVLLALLGWLPFLGWLVALAALLAGLGALALQWRQPAGGATPP